MGPTCIGASSIYCRASDMPASSTNNARNPTTDPGVLTSPFLVGRDEEMATIAGAATRDRALIVVLGQAGVGKTRLVKDVLSRPELATYRHVTGKCQSLREPFLLGPVVECLRTAVDFAALPPPSRLLQQLFPELVARISPSPTPVAATNPGRHQLYREIVDAFSHLGPTVCVLEDLHWADAATIEFVEFLALHQPATTRLMVTLRDEDMQLSPSITARLARSRRDLVRVELVPLSIEEVRQLVEAILDTDEVSSEFAAYLRERTLGLPFAIEEVVRLIQDRRDLIRRNGHWVRRAINALEVPPAVRDAVLERFGRLGPDARSVAMAAAVIRVPAEEPLLAAIADLDRERTTLGLCEALERALLFELGEARYGFRHSLASQAVHSSIPRPQLQRLHMRAAESLRMQRPQPHARLAHHFREAGQRAKSAQHGESAGDLAVTLQDEVTGVHFFEDALRLADLAPATRVRLALKLGRTALRAMTRHAEAADLVGEVLATSPVESGLRGELRYLLGSLLTLAGDASSGRAAHAASLIDLSHAPGLCTLAMAWLAQPGIDEGRVDEHLQWLSRAQALADVQDDPQVALEVLVARANALVRAGDPEGWHAASSLPWETGSREHRHNLVCAAIRLSWGSFHLGCYHRSQAFLADAGRLAEGLGRERYAPSLDSLTLVHCWALGQWDDLETAARRQTELNSHVPPSAIAGLRVLGYLALAKGASDEADCFFTALLDRAKAAGVLRGVAGASAGLAWVSLRRGDPDAAWMATERGLDIIGRERVWVWGAEVGPPAVASLTKSGRDRAVAPLLDELAGGLQGRDAPLDRAALDWSRGIVAQRTGHFLLAAQALLRSAEQYGRLPRPYEEARSRAQAGVCLLEAGDRQGEASLRQALDRFSRLGASADAAQLRRTLRRYSLLVPTPWRGGRRGYGETLSPREREVTDLVTAGHTNAVIAERLYLSQKTVEHHVGSVMRKKGVRSRAALAAQWASANQEVLRER